MDHRAHSFGYGHAELPTDLTDVDTSVVLVRRELLRDDSVRSGAHLRFSSTTVPPLRWIIDLEHLDPGQLPVESAVSAITMADLAAGPHATQDPDERARRHDRLQRAEAVFDPLPFDAEASRAYGRVYAAVVAAGRKARGARAVDLLIASTACSRGLPFYTSDPDDFRALEDLVEIIAV